jgi:23S rRNA (guanosine2251-2'-O)-methyltransferase
VERKDLDLKTDLPHQGVAARFLPRPSLSLTALLATIDPNDPALLLILDHLEDPHNLGALWRTAAALGVKALIAPKDRAATLSTTVYKVAAGGAEALPLITVVNLNRAIEELKKRDFWVVGAEGATGQNLWDFTFPRRTALLLGSEGQGVSRLLKESADFLVHIPLTGPVTSLNVSAAGAILMGAYCRGLGRP